MGLGDKLLRTEDRMDEDVKCAHRFPKEYGINYCDNKQLIDSRVSEKS